MLFDLYTQAGRRGGRAPQPSVKPVFIPAPSGGWNAKDALSSMGKKDAWQLENWVGVPGGIKMRPGRSLWATGLGSYVESLMEYAPPSGLPRLFAAVPTAIYDVSAAGAVGAASQSSLSNGRWQHVNFATSGGNYLFCVNGTDAPRHYNGTAWNQPVITPSTGTLNANNLIGVMSHMNRLWFVEKSTRKVWYLDVQAIAGTAYPFDLSALTPLGGELMAMATWTRDGGEGSDDYGVFITSKGEVLVYAGVNPSSNTTWALQGRYRIPEPIGRRCTIKVGAELVILTSQGPLPMSQVAGLSQASQTNKSVTDKISGAFQFAYANAGSAFGWQMIEHPKTNMLLINVPKQERVGQDQFTFGTTTGAWAKFTGLDCGCLSLFGTDLFSGGNDGVVRKIASYSDEGQPIIATYRHAYMDLGTPAAKIFGMARPRMIAPPGYLPVVQVSTDFDETPITAQTLAALDTGTAWDAGDWDVSPWGAETIATQGWQTVGGMGSTVSVGFRVAATAPVMLNGVDLTYEAGGLM